jgi:hypothetical protein
VRRFLIPFRSLHLITIFRAVTIQLKAVEDLHGHSRATRIAERNKDADAILKAFRNISSLCDVFQVRLSNDQKSKLDSNHRPKIDTQLSIEEKVEDIDGTVEDIDGKVKDILQVLPLLREP